jgi:hypothetical protein
MFTAVPQYVVRAGLVRPRDPIDGTTSHRDMPELTGFSVQSAPGVSVDELARGGLFRNRQISVATRQDLQWYGFKLFFPTPGRGLYHATVQTPYPLTVEVAEQISRLFVQRSNPYMVR